MLRISNKNYIIILLYHTIFHKVYLRVLMI